MSHTTLTDEKKSRYTAALQERLPEIRTLLHMTQSQFGNRIGLSVVRLNGIENGRFPLRWDHLMAILFLCFLHPTVREYLFKHRVVTTELLHFLCLESEEEIASVWSKD